jgi:hypothetical protein
VRDEEVGRQGCTVSSAAQCGYRYRYRVPVVRVYDKLTIFDIKALLEKKPLTPKSDVDEQYSTGSGHLPAPGVC